MARERQFGLLSTKPKRLYWLQLHNNYPALLALGQNPSSKTLEISQSL
jgi:hypothetical protein